MECRDITEREFKLIMAELEVVSRSDGMVETVTGQHEEYGVTVLVRDGSRCMALIDNPACLDRFLAEQAFLAGAGAITGQG